MPSADCFTEPVVPAAQADWQFGQSAFLMHKMAVACLHVCCSVCICIMHTSWGGHHVSLALSLDERACGADSGRGTAAHQDPVSEPHSAVPCADCFLKADAAVPERSADEGELQLA